MLVCPSLFALILYCHYYHIWMHSQHVQMGSFWDKMQTWVITLIYHTPLAPSPPSPPWIFFSFQNNPLWKKILKCLRGRKSVGFYKNWIRYYWKYPETVLAPFFFSRSAIQYSYTAYILEDTDPRPIQWNCLQCLSGLQSPVKLLTLIKITRDPWHWYLINLLIYVLKNSPDVVTTTCV